MARVVLTSWGSYGDVYPYLGLARELKARGHTAVVATCGYYRSLVEAEGITFHPVRPDVDPSDVALIRRVLDPWRGPEALIRDLIAPVVCDSYADLLEALDGAELLVTHPIAFAGPIAAEQMRLRWVSTVLAPISFFSGGDLPVFPPLPSSAHLRRLGSSVGRLIVGLAKRVTARWTRPVAELRRELGLPDRGNPLHEGQFSPYRTLALFSRLLAGPQPDWPPNVTITGFVPYNGPAPTPPELTDFLDRGEPPIVFTLGSSATGVPGTFYEESVAAVRALDVRAVLLTGLDPANRPREPLPTGVLVVDYAPHQVLFPRAAAIVHPGGIGTTGQALRSGRPMLIVPHAHDQPDNAFRVKRLGVARVLYPRRYLARRVVEQLRVLLDDRGYSERADELSRMVCAEDGIGAACDALERELGRPA